MKPTKKVLLAEPKMIDAAYLKLLLEKDGWEPLMAAEPDEVFNLLAKEDIAFVLWDEDMGETQTLAHIKAMYHDLPLVCTTAYSLGFAKQKMLNAGANYCLSKPVYRSRLSEILDSLFGLGITSITA